MVTLKNNDRQNISRTPSHDVKKKKLVFDVESVIRSKLTATCGRAWTYAPNSYQKNVVTAESLDYGPVGEGLVAKDDEGRSPSLSRNKIDAKHCE